jgi:hypothetical protein
LFETVLNFDALNWDSARIRECAEQFDVIHFKERIKRYVEDHYEEFKKGLNQCQMTVI